MEQIIIDINNSVSKIVELSKQKYDNDKSELNRITYETHNKIYEELTKVKSSGQMVRFSNALIALSKKMQSEYMQTRTSYLEEKDELKKKNLYFQLEIQVCIINSYNEIIGIINNYLNRYYNNKIHKNNINNSNEIIELLIKQKSLDPNSEEAIELSKIIYQKREERQILIESLISSKAGKYIFEIESLELRCSILKNNEDLVGTFSSNEFNRIFDDNIRIVNEFEFKKVKTNEDVRLYNQAIRNIKNSLLSLGLDEMFVNEFIMDIIKYNLDEDYHSFELHNGLGFSRKKYDIKIDEIKEKINSIKGNSIRKGKIVVSNKLETYEELIEQINKIYELIDKKYTDSLGGQSVHR